MTETLIYSAVALIAGFLLAFLFRKRQSPQEVEAVINAARQNAQLETEKNCLQDDNRQLKAQNERLQERLQIATGEVMSKETKIAEDARTFAKLQEDYRAVAELHREAVNTIRQLEQQKAIADAELKAKNQQLELQRQEIDNIGEQFESKFRVLAQDILNEKSRVFNETQERSLTDMLKPLRDNINAFKTEIGARYDIENNERISLKEQIRLITETNRLLSEQATNLTNALKGQVKHQGEWGEMILESILEYSGLTKGIHYVVQERVRDAEGRAFVPDIIVKYPDGRNVIIDSKVSLLHYTDYCSCTDPVLQEGLLKKLIDSVYGHIASLSSKEYQQKVNALDFVMLFFPMEGAYITAMQRDSDIWRYAYSKKVLLISQTNLIPAMKLVYDLWKTEEINSNAQAIGEKAIKIYEKLAAFVEEFDKVGSQLQKVSATYQDATKKLYAGRGNLIAQASQMKSMLMHNKPARDISPSLLESALIEDEAPVEIDDQPE